MREKWGNLSSREDKSAPLLEIRGLRCAFTLEGRRIEALRGVDLTLTPGEILGIVGESGGGKTLTMRSIIRMPPRGAEIQAETLRFAGLDLRELPEKSLRALRGRDISMIFQDPMTSLNPLKRVDSHIMETLLRRASLGRKRARDEALSLLERVGIPSAEARMRQYPHELSGGMRQRVLIAMALACKPKLLIADEPAAALDLSTQARILALLRALRQKEGMAVILITHDLGAAAALCHRVAVMYAGLVVETGPVDDIFARPLHPYTQALLRCLETVRPACRKKTEGRERLAAIEGHPCVCLPQPPSALNIPPPGCDKQTPGCRKQTEGCPFAPRCVLAGPECEEALPSTKNYGLGSSARCFRIKQEASEL
ncbi:MAG: ABC transporter ATP-binding protein [Treponema sp.]|nr:ABC transporter ATP-binding protein [Treponema sp.]